jgi:hypothetical protein
MGIAINTYGFLAFCLWLYILIMNIRAGREIKRKYNLKGIPTFDKIKSVGTTESSNDYLNLKNKVSFYLKIWCLFLLLGMITIICIGLLTHSS